MSTCYWMSWYQPTEDHRPLTYPPNDAVLGWWCSGYADKGDTLCAMVEADSDEAAWDVVRKDWPEAIERICERRDEFRLSDRFPLTDWMKPRLKKYLSGVL